MPQRKNTLTLGTDRALYVGEIPATGWHCHASPVLLMGLSGAIADRYFLQNSGPEGSRMTSIA